MYSAVSYVVTWATDIYMSKVRSVRVSQVKDGASKYLGVSKSVVAVSSKVV